MEIQGFVKTPGDLVTPQPAPPLKRVWVLVTWERQEDHMWKEVRPYFDEDEAIEGLKDALPIRDRADLFWCDETGGWGRVPGW